jgi:hypothetical protein
MNGSLLSSIFDIAIYTFAIVDLFIGVLLIGSLGISKKSLFPLIFGVFYLIAHAAISYTYHNMQLDSVTMMQQSKLPPELATDWGADLPPPKRTEISLSFARIAFGSHGKLRYYFDLTGNKQLFVPSQTDLDKREEVTSLIAELNYSASVSLERAKSSLIVAFFAALFGYLCSRGSQLTLHSRGTPQKRGAP